MCFCGPFGTNLAKIDILSGHVCLRYYTDPAAPTARTVYPIASASVAAAVSPLSLSAPLIIAA